MSSDYNEHNIMNCIIVEYYLMWHFCSPIVLCIKYLQFIIIFDDSSMFKYKLQSTHKLTIYFKINTINVYNEIK